MSYDERQYCDRDAEQARELRVTFGSILLALCASLVSSALALGVLAAILKARGLL